MILIAAGLRRALSREQRWYRTPESARGVARPDAGRGLRGGVPLFGTTTDSSRQHGQQDDKTTDASLDRA